MKKWNKSLMTIAAAICMGTAGFAATAFAAGPDMETGPGYGEDGRQEERWKAFMEKKQAELHDKLKLSASQEGAWKTYTDATAKTLTPPKRTAIDFDSMTAPQRMEKGLEFMKERQAKMEAQLASLKTFYATLTPEQQKVFDAETSPKKWREKARDRTQKKSRPANK
ncbi:Spy/CpxP family protein refolding chaperone [Oxalobacter vibrioformis]|uniref:Spy/CpxP family protein refolding chaperone n=1 Tax=Oxalobacter vibrioformis TaxID=933080 RepID=A0A9E9LWW3_9BURK|nr:Spy/CpxP family protein refolding chaperone [Oxalobacter vibrioformis]NLC23045.1 Spy/CpxP family protein refolding chaperone [Oxalobacter sp.]WAW08992.1 Spy/CpxP family protein refolding chaperone [Oxalobacter vibrioformis]